MPRFLILSDIHGNWEALASVLQGAAGHYDAVLCCGDTVGYGADPNRTAEWVREHAQRSIRGNHDRACATLADIDGFNPLAQAATRWTHSVLSEENRQWLGNLPTGPAAIDGFDLVHGSPLGEDEYLLDLSDAHDVFDHVNVILTFFGHTHVQCAFENSRMRTRRWTPGELSRGATIQDTSAYLVNPGSVGQPRDGDPRAAYALYDSDSRTLSLHRVSYDIAAAQRKILDAQLPAALALRLSRGH